MRPGDHISCTLWDILIQQYMSNGNAPTLQRVCSCEENCRRTYTDWTAVSPETTETGVADLFYTVLFNGSKDAGRREISVNSKKDADVRFALTGQWLKSITFHLPIIDGEMKIPVNNGLDKNAHVETVRCNI